MHTMVPESDTEPSADWSTRVVVRELAGVMLTSCAADAGAAGAVECGDRLLTAANDDRYGASP